MVIEVLRGIGLRGLNLKDLRSQGVGRGDGRGADGLLRGEEDYQDTAVPFRQPREIVHGKRGGRGGVLGKHRHAQQHEGHEKKKQFFHKKLLSSTAGKRKENGGTVPFIVHLER